MSQWQILGRWLAAPPADWRDRLVARLGSRPRRLGPWCELGLFGALECLADAGETRLPEAALVSVASLHGPDRALRDALAQLREDGLPLPLGFLQSQPNQLLAHFCAATGWQGDARTLGTRAPLDALRIATQGAADELLLGWVDEDGKHGHVACSRWLRLRRQPADASAAPPCPGAPDLPAWLGLDAFRL
ncbi:MAG: hypothetical protein REI09_01245 [Candidatus Dactylopiibacterium sp.]|nr:hypothetical protein [Candidatus Dactylopiibacterium sp.]